MSTRRDGTGLPRMMRGRLLSAVAVMLAAVPSLLQAGPYVPAGEDVVLAELSAGTRYADVAARRLARNRLDVAIPLAQFYIQQSRLSGDLRFLGYAQAVLAPWVDRSPASPDVLVLQATLQQSRHEFAASLATLDRALTIKPDNAQALLIRATVLRVLGRYAEAGAACEQFSRLVESRLGAICIQGVRGLNGELETAYTALSQISPQGWLNSEKSWLYSELGEMAVRMGRDDDATRWFERDLAIEPGDFYVRAAYADLLLRKNRPADALALLRQHESFEPLLLRIAIAQQRLGDPGLARTSALLRAAFAAELQRGEAVHRREQARFLLEIEDQPRQSLEAALQNWQVQREPDDLLVLLHAAQAAADPAAAAAAINFVRSAHQTDARAGELRVSAIPGVSDFR